MGRKLPAVERPFKIPGGDFEGQRMQYELSQLVPRGMIVLLGLYFYLAGRHTRSNSVDNRIVSVSDLG